MKVLALDFGGSSIKFSLFNRQGESVQHGKVPAPRVSEAECEKAIDEIMSSLVERPDAIGISMGGKLDAQSGMIISSGQFPYFKGLSMTDWMREKTGLPVTVQNDAHAAAIAEMERGSLQGVQNAVVIVLGTGIGGAIILNGKIWEGSRHCAAEFSLLRESGNRDLFTSWLFTGGATGLTTMVKQAIPDAGELDGYTIFSMLNDGDERVKQVIERFCEIMAIQIYNIQAILDVDKVVIGGGISAQPILLELTDKYLTEIYAAEASYAFPPQKPEVAYCAFRSDANLIGAWVDCVNRLRL